MWYIKSVLRIRVPIEPERLVFGTRAHAVAQAILEGREPEFVGWEHEVGLAFAELTREALDELIQPAPGRPGEWSFSIPIDGATIRGKADAVGYRAGVPVVVDHKTASDPRRHASTAEVLSRNPQAQLYAAAILRAEPAADRVILHWHWMPSKRRANARAVEQITEITVTRAQAEAWFAGLLEICAEMLTARASEFLPPPYYDITPDPLRLRCLGEGEGNYPCDYLGGCEDMSFLDSLKNKTETKEAPAPSRPIHAETVAVSVNPPAALNPNKAAPPADFGARVTAARDALRKADLPDTADAILGYLLGAAR